jgi:hypothetical protein
VHLFMSLLLLTLTAACMQPTPNIPKVTADFRFSNATGLGIQNAGFLDLGTMFVWDLSDNVLHPIGVAELDLAPAPNVLPGSQASTGVQGVKVSGVPKNLSGKNGLLAIEIGKQTKFSVEGAIKHSYRNVTAPFKQYVQNEVQDGNNPDSTLRPRDDKLRIVMINSVLRVQKFEMSVGGTSASDPNTVAHVSIAIPGVEIASIRVHAGHKLTCGSGKVSYKAELPPACFFNVVVGDPHYTDREEDGGRMQFLTKHSPLENCPPRFENFDLPPKAPSFITRVCGFGFHILHHQSRQVWPARSRQIAQAPASLQRVSGFPAIRAA